MGRLADRFGIAVPLAIGTLALGPAISRSGMPSSLWQVALATAADRASAARPRSGR